MATPTEFSVPPIEAADLARLLEEESRRTPDIEFRTSDVQQSYQWLCEIEHDKFPPSQVDKLRRNITQPEYWECEARHLKDALSEHIWQNALREYDMDEMPSTDGWLGVITFYTRLLKQHGLSSKQVRECRLSIKTQTYWQPEAKLLREVSALQEIQMVEKHLAKKARRARQSKPTTRSVPAGKVSARITRPKASDSIGARVAKRRGKVGAKAR